jgi:hypothetical protein
MAKANLLTVIQVKQARRPDVKGIGPAYDAALARSH